MKQSLALCTLWLVNHVTPFTPIATFSHNIVRSSTILQQELRCKSHVFDFQSELPGKGTLKITFEPCPNERRTLLDKIKRLFKRKKDAPLIQSEIPEKGTLKAAFESCPKEQLPQLPQLPLLPEAFSNIRLPREPERLIHDITQRKVQAAAGALFPLFDGLFNQKKDSTQAIFDDIQTYIVTDNDLGRNIPDKESYKFFGNGESGENLKMLLKTNPFMAPALQSRGDGKGFELKSFDPNNKNPTLYQKIIGELTGVGRRVNIQFDSKMENIEGFQMYDDVTGQVSQTDMDIDEVASSAIYNIFAFAQTIHATIHVLHYIYTAALQIASKDAEFEPMNQWANDYAKHIPEKYGQVATKLITSDNVDAIITGANGLGFAQAASSESAPIRGILKNMLQDWVKNPSADGFYMDNMMELTADEMKSGGILEEFSKHLELSKEFAAETCKALEKTDAIKFKTAETSLVNYLKDCGKLESRLESTNQWVEMMAVTGAMHGSTLSFTRLTVMPEVMRWRQKEVLKWTSVDINIIRTITLTMFGMDDGIEEGYNGRHVMSKSALSGESADLLQGALDKYNDKATTLKTEYMNKLIESSNRDKFNNYGWILSDWCPDSFDGKQLTIATYI